MFCWQNGRSVCGNSATFWCNGHEKMLICRSEGCESITTRRRRRRGWSLRKNCSLGTCKCPSFRVSCNRKGPIFFTPNNHFFAKTTNSILVRLEKGDFLFRKTRKDGHLRGPRLQFLPRDQQDLFLRCARADSHPCDPQMTTFTGLLQHNPPNYRKPNDHFFCKKWNLTTFSQRNFGG